MCALLIIVGCQPAPPTTTAAPGTWKFEDVTESSNVTCRYDNGRSAGQFAILESLGGGVGIVDFDQDGVVDLAFPGGGNFSSGEHAHVTGAPLSLYRGLGGWKWTDTSNAAGVGTARRFTHGMAVGDFDNDGFDDLTVTGYEGIDIWHNQGDGTFELVDESSGVIDPAWSSSAGWGDIDGDGNLDLFVAHYVNWSTDNNPPCSSSRPDQPRDVCPPRKFEGLNDLLLKNQGDGRFADSSSSWGIAPQGKGLGVLLADIDNDLDTDIYVANDTVNNFLYVNQGNGHAEEMALLSGCATDALGKPNGSMGVEFFDYNLDLTGDLWVTNFEQETACLYQGLGEHQFTDLAREQGIAAMGDLFVGFGTLASDFDGDGDRDIVVANGHVIYYPEHENFEQQSIVLENQNGQQFVRAPFDGESFFSQRYAARGVASADFDGNGTADLVITTLNGGPRLLSNQCPQHGRSIRLTLKGRQASRSALGSRVVLKSDQGERVAFLNGGGSYLSASHQVCDFSVPDHSSDCSATIYWPYGQPQSISGLKPGNHYLVEEPLSESPGRVLKLNASIHSTP